MLLANFVSCRVPLSCPRLLINLEKVGEVSSLALFLWAVSQSLLTAIPPCSLLPASLQTDPIMAMLGLGIGFDFSEGSAYRDVFEAGTCDNGVRKLAGLLGWEVTHKNTFELYCAGLQ